MVPDPIVGIVLAAGSSSRLGRPKQLEPFSGKPLVRYTVERVLKSSIDRVLVVVGAEEDRVTAALTGLAVEIVSNPEFATGQASSVIAGVTRAQDLHADAVVVLLADQPGVKPEAINALVSERRSSGVLVGMARYGEQRSHPVLFGHEVFPELLALSGDTGGREIIQRHRESLVLVDGGRDTIPADLDTDADLSMVKQDLE